VIERGHAERLDAEDPLARFRERFVLGEPGTIYLDGNSLGRLSLATRSELHNRTEQWGADLVTGCTSGSTCPSGPATCSPKVCSAPSRRGAHVSLRHAEAWPIARALIKRARVIPDFR
jgi:kynureninase